jgi:drug/metabolite transporter (DMT)-like permease
MSAPSGFPQLRSPMKQELTIAILTGAGGMLGWGLADFFAKKTIDQIGDIIALAWGHLFGTGLLVAVWSFQAAAGQSVSIPKGLRTWTFLFLFGAGQAVIYLLVYRGFSKGKVGLLAPVFACFSGLTAVLSITLFGERLRGWLPAALGLIFTGVLLINADAAAIRTGRFRFSQIGGFREIAVATILAALWTILWDKFVEGEAWITYALWMYGFMTLTILVVAAIGRQDLRKVDGSLFKFLFLIGLCETGAYLAITLGYSTTRFTSVVAILSGAFSLPTIILARLFLKEKITALQTFGGLVTVLGIMLVAALKQI